MNEKKIIVQKYLSDIRFWIVLFFVIRLYGITDAPLEAAHNWRQSLTNMIARNFLQMDSNILYPKVDTEGNLTGIMGTEFPFFNYLIFIVAKTFGYAHWYGRLINLMVSSIGIFYFYKIIKRFFNGQLAYYASLILLSSLWFPYSRKTMPDTFCMSLVLIGIYYGLIYLYEKKVMQLVLFFIFCSLAILCKIPSLYLLPVIIIPLFDKQIKMIIKLHVAVAGIFILIVMYIWYFYWTPYLINSYHSILYFPQPLFEGFKQLIYDASNTFEKFYFVSLESYVAFFLFLTGLFLVFKMKQKLLMYIFLSSSFVFLLFMCKTGYVFATHTYYVIPYVPVMALLAAFALTQIESVKYKIIVTFVLMSESILNQQNDFRIPNSEKYKLQMESIANKFSTRNDLIIINGGGSPQSMYFLNRRGWSKENVDIANNQKMEGWKNEGFKYIFIDKHKPDMPDLSKYKEVYSDENFVVYKF